MIKAVLFDFDGVICDTEPQFFEYKLKKMNEMGFPVTREFLLERIGESFRVMFPREFKVDDPEKYINEYYSGVEHSITNYNKLMFPEVIDLLDYCVSHHLICAITSNSKHERLEAAVKEMNIDKYFSNIYSNESLGVAKPNPLFYTKVLEDLHLLPEEAIVIEDSVHGIVAAKDANIYTIAKKENYFHIDQSYADTQIDKLTEVIDIIEKKNEYK